MTLIRSSLGGTCVEEMLRFVDITRQVNRHLSFGVGHHRFTGSTPARMGSLVAVRRFFERFPSARLSEAEEPEYQTNLQLPGFSKLPLELI